MNTKKKHATGIFLERVLLHNWYRYHNQIISLGDTSLITGATGSGKSVINDGIQYVLTTSTSFNKASGNDSEGKRTVFSYVRGDTGNGFLRPEGCVTAYIFLEFRNAMTDRRFIAGAAVESRNAADKQTTTTRYVIYEDGKDVCLEDIRFMDEYTEKFVSEVTVGKNRIALKRYLSQNNETYKNELTRLFGEDFNYTKFQDLIKKAIAYKPDKKLEVSLRELLFGERRIDVNGSLDILEEINRVEDIIENNQKKIEYLTPIVKEYERYNDLKEKARINDIAKIYAEVCYAKEDAQKKEKECADALYEAETKKRNQNELLEKKKENESLISALQAQINGISSEYGTEKIEYILESRKASLRKKKKKEKSLERYVTDLSELKNISSEIREVTERFEETLTAADMQAQTDAFALLREKTEEVRETLTDELTCLRTDIILQERKKSELDRKYEEMKKRKSAVNPEISRFMEKLHEKARRDRKVINPVILADVIDRIDPDWQPWIEDILGWDREIILCDPNEYSYIKDAVAESEIRRIRLLDYNAIRAGAVVKGNSLAEKIETKHLIAADFLKYKLGGIIICEKSKLETYRSSVCIEGLRYNGYSLLSLEDRKDRYCLGRKAIEDKKRRLQDNIRYITGVITEKKKKAKEISGQLSVIDICRITKENAEDMIHAKTKADILVKEIQKMEESLIALKKDPNYIRLSIEVGNAMNETKTLTERLNNLYYEIRTAEEKVERLRGTGTQSIHEIKEKLRNKKEAFEEYTKEDQEAAKKFLKTKDKRSFESRSIQWDRMRSELNTSANNLEKEISRFTGKFPEEEHGSGEENFSHYAERKESLYAENAVELANDIQTYKNRFKNNFKTTVLSKLYGNILWAKQFKKELNKTLKDIRFGDDTYQLCVTSTGDEDRKKLLNMITNVGKHMEEYGDLGDLDIRKREMTDEFCEEVINSLKSLNRDKRDAAFTGYLDYRNYLEFDVEKNNGISLKDKLGSDSGGEAQTAYYVIIAAAFSNIYDENSIRLVMIDEAFDKIDDNRKARMLRFLIDLGFQCMITTPTIAPFVTLADTVVSVVKANRYSYAKSRSLAKDYTQLFSFERKEIAS